MQSIYYQVLIARDFLTRYANPVLLNAINNAPARMKLFSTQIRDAHLIYKHKY